MKTKNVLSFVLFIFLLIAILYGGPIISKSYDNKYRRNIDKNGIVLPAIVYDRKTYKGKTVHFSYTFNGSMFSNHQQSECLFFLLNKGDSITIKIDASNPEDSYILSPTCQEK
jgi:hypothetical protein